MSTSTLDSFIIHDNSPSTDDDDLDSLPSTISSGTDSTDSQYHSDAQREWEQSLDQLQLLLTMVMIPFVGKYMGRKFAYWSTFSPTATSGTEAFLSIADFGYFRLGEVHGMDA